MNRFLLCILSIYLAQQISAQSKTVEFTPKFIFEDEAFISEEIDLSKMPKTAAFIGVSAYHFGDQATDLYFRIYSEDNWSKWFNFRELDEYVSWPRHAYEAKPIYGSPSRIQFKTSVQNKITIRLFYARAAEEIQAISVSRNLDCTLPDICDRTCWCSSCPIDATPQFTDPTHIIVHHSAGFNESNDFAGVVEYYWDLHVNTNGWDDIGYNWLIDANGVIYQGRPDNFQGAHFSCINENTVGICVIGDFTTVTPTEEAITALTNLIGFEASEHDNACSTTVCPGDSFYPMLGDLREAVNALECYQDAISEVLEIDGDQFKIYPSPFKDVLYISCDSGKSSNLQLLSVDGKLVMQLQTNTLSNTSHLSPGIYLVVYNGNILKKVQKH